MVTKLRFTNVPNLIICYKMGQCALKNNYCSYR